MKIRKTEIMDIERVLEVFDSARQYMRASGNMEQWVGNYPSEEVIRSDINRGWSHVIELNGEIVATFCLMTTPEPSYSDIDGEWLNDEPYVTLHRVASDGTSRGILHTAVEYAALSYANIRVDTHADNRPMLDAIGREVFARCGVVTLADGSLRTAFQKVV
ncbi:MAG: GNAT family N-acetyltransferase [Muribaculum sp.]|nr:GNAT family N-acetyltransferase [Muribaculaceae bacterium]MCM1080861.1 GNAT family N-acetyltransferase [Muribaculum sp.]